LTRCDEAKHRLLGMYTERVVGGMLTAETIGRIRRGHFAGKTVKALSRELRVSRNMVRKILRSGTTSASYERKNTPLPQLGPWLAALDGPLELKANAVKKSDRERLTLIRLFEELRRLAYQGGHDAAGTPGVGNANTQWRRPQPMCRFPSRRASPTSSTGATRSWC
jgi:hypothetical protein